MKKRIRVHRVGSITTGMSMIVYGIMFILHVFLDMISYKMIFGLWPFIIIGLGIEVLLSNVEDREFVYDKAAVFLLIIISFFAVCMAGADLLFAHYGSEFYISI